MIPGLSTAKLIGAGVGLLMLLGLILGLKHYHALATDRGEKLAAICTATRNASGNPKLKCSEVPAQIEFMREALDAVRVKTAKAQAEDAAHAKAVEANQASIGQETSRDYQAELARVRADYAERLRRSGTATANSSGRGNAPVSRAPASAGGPDAATAQGGLPAPDALTATEQALQLKAFQDWARREGLAR